MFRVPLSKFDTERAIRKGLRVIIESTEFALVRVDTSQYSQFLKSYGLSKSEATPLTNKELETVVKKLKQKPAAPNSSNSSVNKPVSQAVTACTVKASMVEKKEQLVLNLQ